MGLICTNLANELGHHLVWKITILLMGKSTISMAIFNSYGSLPEGTIPGMNHQA